MRRHCFVLEDPADAQGYSQRFETTGQGSHTKQSFLWSVRTPPYPRLYLLLMQHFFSINIFSFGNNLKIEMDKNILKVLISV